MLVFPSDRAFTPFKPRYNGRRVSLGGLFMRRPDASDIALLRDLDEDGMRVIFHEYAHLVISNATNSLPLWLNEGIVEFSADWLAAYFAGTTLVNPFAGRDGSPDAARARAREEFLRAAGEGRGEIPNAVAKAATLFLMRGDDPGPERRAGIARAQGGTRATHPPSTPRFADLPKCRRGGARGGRAHSD